MLIGVPTEVKANENRIALVPAGASALVSAGHRVVIQKGAGVGSGIEDCEYEEVGAEIVPDAVEVYNRAEMIVKVKEPQEQEFKLFKEGQILFTYLHLAASEKMTRHLLENKVTCIGYETVQLDNGSLPLLNPMSEVAGRMSVSVGAHFLQKGCGGRGVLLGGVPGVEPAEVVIVGAGTVGLNAAKMAVGLGARVTIIDINLDKLHYIDDLFRGSVTTLYSTSFNIARQVRQADLLISGVLIPGAKAPKLVTEAMVRSMKPGAVIVDVAIDQGGSVETVDRATTHDDPVYIKYGVVHYSVANMPSMVARTSTYSLTNSTLPYLMQLANKGFYRAVNENLALARGVNLMQGKVTCPAVAECFNLKYVPLKQIIA